MLHLMTLNLNYRVAKHGAWERRRDLIAAAADRVGADLLALQAVEAIDGDNQAEELARLLGFPCVVFVAAQTDGATGRGSAFVSRIPLSEVEAFRLSRRPGHEDGNDRLLLRAAIVTEGGPLLLHNAHFSWVTPQAIDNAREALAFAGQGPALLLGDLNSDPGSPAIDLLKQGGYVDVWVAKHPGDAGHTFEADRPTLRIDYVLASAEAAGRVQGIDLVTAGTSGGSVRLSDHLGLVCSVV